MKNTLSSHQGLCAMLLSSSTLLKLGHSTLRKFIFSLFGFLFMFVWFWGNTQQCTGITPGKVLGVVEDGSQVLHASTTVPSLGSFLGNASSVLSLTCSFDRLRERGLSWACAPINSRLSGCWRAHSGQQSTPLPWTCSWNSFLPQVGHPKHR